MQYGKSYRAAFHNTFQESYGVTEHFLPDGPNQVDQAPEAALAEMPPPEASQALVPAVVQTTLDNAWLGHANKTSTPDHTGGHGHGQ